MGLLAKIGRIFSGNKSKIEKNLVQKEAYWDGLMVELDKKVEQVQANYRKTSAIVNVKRERRASLQKAYDEMQATAIESRERFKETNDESYKTNAMNAFNKMSHHKAALEVIDEELTQLERLQSELKVMVDNAQDIARAKKAEIIKAKSRVQFSDTMKGLTDGIKEFTTMELDGSEEVDITYHENLENLKDLTGGVVRPVTKESDFDAFFNEGATA